MTLQPARFVRIIIVRITEIVDSIQCTKKMLFATLDLNALLRWLNFDHFLTQTFPKYNDHIEQNSCNSHKVELQ